MVKYRVKFVKRIGDGSYGGMNYFAAHDLKMKFPHRKDTITIAKGQSAQKVRDTIRHETLEAELMRKTGMPYRKSHQTITRLERKRK